MGEDRTAGQAVVWLSLAAAPAFAITALLTAATRKVIDRAY